MTESTIRHDVLLGIAWLVILAGGLACACWGFWVIRALESTQ